MTAPLTILRRPCALGKPRTQRRARVFRDSLADGVRFLRFRLGLPDTRRAVWRTRVREALCTAVFLATSGEGQRPDISILCVNLIIAGQDSITRHMVIGFTVEKE